MERIADTPESWEDGTLGRDPEFAERLDEETWAKEQADLEHVLKIKKHLLRERAPNSVE